MVGSSYTIENRGTFACVGSDDKVHNITAAIEPDGELRLTLDDGRRVTRLYKGRYFARGEPGLSLRCDHPDAP